MLKKEKYSYLIQNTLLFTISSFGSKILSFLLVPFYTNILSTSDYGTADLITTTTTLLIFIFTINIADSVLRFAIERSEKQEEILFFGIKVLVIGSIVLGGCLLLCWKYEIIKWDDYCYVFLFINFFVSALNQIVFYYLRAIDDIVAVAVAGIITTAFTIISNITLLLIIRIGIIGYLISLIIGTTASTIYGLIRMSFRITKVLIIRCDKRLQKTMCNYSIPLIFNGIAWWMNNGIDKYFITLICGIAQNGIYAVAYKIPTILLLFSSIFAQAWNLSAIKEFDKNDKDHFFVNMYTMYNAGLVIICSGLILLNIPLAKFLFAKDFFEAWQYSSVLLISIIFSGLSSFIGSVFSAVKASNIFAISTVSAALINIILNILLVPRWQLQGAAVATAISFMAIWLIRLICSRKYICWKLKWKVDVVAYLLLAMQVIFEHIKGHGYFYQLIIFIVIIILYKNQLIYLFHSFNNKE